MFCQGIFKVFLCFGLLNDKAINDDVINDDVINIGAIGGT